MNPHDSHRATTIDSEVLSRFALLVDDIYRSYFGGPTGRWVSAHPADGVYVKEILEMFPNARVLFLTRHPQEVVWSSLHASWAQPKSRYEFLDSAVSSARWWRRFARVCVDALDGKFDSRVLVVRHERMIDEPQDVARECLNFIGETYEPSVAASLGTVFNSSFLPDNDASRRVRESHSGLKDDAVLCRKVIEITGDYMERLGYPDLGGRIENPRELYLEKQDAMPSSDLNRLLRRLRSYFHEHPKQARWVYRMFGLRGNDHNPG
jgi:hypothetical protein